MISSFDEAICAFVIFVEFDTIKIIFSLSISISATVNASIISFVRIKSLLFMYSFKIFNLSLEIETNLTLFLRILNSFIFLFV